MSNFHFLGTKRRGLVELGRLAERLLSVDPSSALVKMRQFAEELVAIVYDEKRLPRPYRANFNDLLNEVVFEDLVPPVVVSKLHTVRIRGNKAAHPTSSGKTISRRDAIDIVEEAFHIARWFYVALDAGKAAAIPAFVAPPANEQSSPPSTSQSKAQLKREKKALLEKLARQEAELLQVLTNYEAERNQRLELERATEEEKTRFREEGLAVANELAFDEAQTRQFLIDALLIEAGWDVGGRGKSSEEVGQEVPLSGLPSKTGKGYADYVLWGDDGKPLAVIEAKRTSKSPNAGRTQAKQYADALEAEHGQRPLIFYTNGVRIHLWDDAPTLVLENGSQPRKVYGFYSKDSLEYALFQRNNAVRPELVPPSKDIAGRLYQVEAIKRVTARFGEGYRKALIVQATGTGKTRVSISICDLLIRAKWAKRVLFLCDRRELRRQADGAFKEFLPSEPRAFVTAKTSADRNKRIYLATYPAMIKCFRTFDVGFFDLIIADESHRSIYNRYGDLFRYFDAFQVGLTATPRKMVDHHTYELFGCEDSSPTAYYGIEEAIKNRHLVPFRVVKVTTKFQREGIHWDRMNDEQRRAYEAECANTDTEYDAKDLDKKVYNRDTARSILRNLMNHGIRDVAGSLPGKSIIFARNHKHAELLEEVFAELYPTYGGEFCQVIDTYNSRAEQLIDDLKNPKSKLRIAISVDMLDTGIDVPELVNLVFAKSLKSNVKFWQMIGRGTRLRPNLLGPGVDKKEFLIFDHGGNFDYFKENPGEIEAKPVQSLMQRLFVARVELGHVALQKFEQDVVGLSVGLITGDIKALKKSQAIDVRDHWHELELLSDQARVASFDAATHARLIDTIAPLMRWVDVRGHEHARRFDLLIAKAQRAKIEGSSEFADLQGKIETKVAALRVNLNQVKAKADTIKKVRDPKFWKTVDAMGLEELRTELRAIMKYSDTGDKDPGLPPVYLDVPDSDEVREEHEPTFEGQQLIAYRNRVEGVLKEHFASDPILARIRAGYAVTDDDLSKLAAAVLRIDPQINLKHLPTHIDVKGDLHRALRSIVGLDVAAVAKAFQAFLHRHLEMSAQQVRFLDMLRNHLCNNGGLEIDRLYEAPFTTVNAQGIDGVFNDNLIDELLDLIGRFELPAILELDGAVNDTTPQGHTA